MTFIEYFKKYFEDRGLWSEEANAVIEIMQADKANESMSGRWTDKVEEYPPQILSVLGMGADRAAVEWIDANKPHHWARGMFPL